MRHRVQAGLAAAAAAAYVIGVPAISSAGSHFVQPEENDRRPCVSDREWRSITDSVRKDKLEAQWEEPPLEMIQTQPLFGPDMQPDSSMVADLAAKKAANAAPPAPPAPVKPPGKE